MTDTCQAKTAEGTRCPIPASWDLVATCPDGTVRASRMCTRHASTALNRGMVCDLHGGSHVTVANIAVHMGAVAA